jgi:hypothetical protein
MSWLVYKRGTIEPFRAYLLLFGVYKYFRHDIGASQPRTLYINEGDKLHWSWEKTSFDKFNKQLLDFLKNPRRLSRHFDWLDKTAEPALADCQHLIKTDLTKLSN